MRTKNLADIYELTGLQTGLLFHTLGTPDSGVYVNQLACRLQGDLDVGVFAGAWRRVVERHPVLRTGFVWQELQRPQQVVWQRVELPWREHDWRELSPEEQELRWQQLLQEDRRGFELERAPLMRLTLVRVGEQAYRFAWSHHHLLLDGWSLALVLKELLLLYEGGRLGGGPTPPAPRPFRDFVAWLRRQDRAGAEAYWRRQLSGLTAPTLLGVDGPAAQEVAGAADYAEARLRLPAEATAALQGWARRQQVTLNTVVQGAWALLLSRYSGSQDVCFGVTVAGRPATLPGVESMVGLFINTLPLRVAVPPDTPLAPWLQQLQARQAEMRQYEHSPLVEVHGWSDVPRGTPLFESLLVFENYPVDRALPAGVGGGVRVSDVELREQTNYALTVVAVPGAELELRAGYERGRFEEGAVRRLLGHLQTLLEAMPTAGERPLFALPLLGEGERRQVLLEWNQTAADYPQGVCVHELFEQQAERSPEAVAVVFGEQQWTYAELNARANRLAHHLRTLGVGPEVRVGICVERSLAMVAGILGILKAAGAYVPLDPNYPAERLAYLLHDAQVPVLLTQAHLRDRLPEHQAQVVLLEGEQEAWLKGAEHNPRSGVRPENLAYVLYTSGSTGSPKGVILEHHSAVNFLNWACAAFTPEESASVIAGTSICFDLSVFELLMPLCRGGRVLLVPDVLYLPERLQRGEGTLLNTVPSAMVELVLAGRVPTGVRTVNLAGEPLSLALAEAIYRIATIEKLYNLYGPTEGTTYSTYKLVLPFTETAPPIGAPIANTQVYVVDGHLQPVPVGMAGELYIGGAGLARGYLNRPGLTAERFVPDPFAAQPGSRLYRTGDRVRWRADGNLEFLGRLDQQVKLRGFRIEPGEVEAALLQHPAVRQAVVLAREDGPGGKRLVAYVVVPTDVRPTAADVRAFLQGKLPEYMVPSACVFLEALPLTPNGKLDRQALPAPDRQPAAQGYLAPRTEPEEALANTWAEVLGLERVGVQDNFFELGGDSILAIQVVARANRSGLRLSPRLLFQHQTVAELAQAASLERPVQAEQGPVTGAAPLTPIQHWFLDQNSPQPHHFNMALLFAVQRPVAPDLLGQALNHLAAHHDALRLRFTRRAQGWEQFHADRDWAIGLQQIDLAHLPADQQGKFLEDTSAQVQRSLDLEQGPMTRVVLFHLGADRPCRLLFVVHHLIVDPVSWRVLLEDLLTAYHQLEQGQPVQLPPKTTSWQNWTRRLTDYATSGTVHQELRYWLSDARRQVQPLPIDRSEGDDTLGNEETVQMVLTENRTRTMLSGLGPAGKGTQINDILLTALLRSFYRWSGSPLLLVDLEGHGREEIFDGIDLSRTVGWFTTLHPVLLESLFPATLRQVLQAVQQQCRAVPNRGLGYGLLCYSSDDEMLRARFRSMPQAEVLFDYVGQVDRGLPMEIGLRLAKEPIGLAYSPQMRRPYLLQLTCMIVEERLQMDWRFNPGRHYRSTVEGLAQGFVETLEELIGLTN